jgi:hypothetical protein
MPPRTIALIGAICVTLGWLMASVVTPPVARVQVLPERRSAPASAVTSIDAPTQYTEELQLRLRRMPDPPAPRRNPFAFSSKRSTVSSSSSSIRPTDSAPAPVTIAPGYTLAGIAARNGTNGTRYTAILSDGATVHLVNVGDAIGRYTVIAISDSDATLEDASGGRHIFRLR